MLSDYKNPQILESRKKATLHTAINLGRIWFLSSYPARDCVPKHKCWPREARIWLPTINNIKRWGLEREIGAADASEG